jgi:hypothetical protein
MTCACCLKGGCCYELPEDTKERVFFEFTVSACCCGTPSNYGFGEDFKGAGQGPPDELRGLGISRAKWIEYMEKLEPLHKQAPTECWKIIVAMLTCCIIPCCVFPDSWGVFHADLKTWQDEFNEKILKPKGAFVKTFCSATVHHNNGKANRVETSYIAFAMTPAEAVIMEQEPHLLGGPWTDKEREFRVI